MDKPQEQQDDSAPQSGLLQRIGPLLKHWAIFIVVLGSLVGVHQWKPVLVNGYFSLFTAKLLAITLSLLGKSATATEYVVTCEICSFRIIGECTAFYPMAIYVAAVLAFPSSLAKRAVGVLLGIPVLLVINQVRLTSLCYIVRSFPEYFDTIHIVVWQTLIIFLTLLVWITWAATLANRR
jgi:archaeosortase B (VPXXXP-CTERM-specific)